MTGTSRTHGREAKCMKTVVKKHGGMKPIGSPGVDERIILE
jgi:hypothetical protein